MNAKVLKISLFFSLLLIITSVYAIQAFAIASVAPATNAISIENNIADIPDTVTVGGLSEGDVVKVYSAAKALSPIGGTVSAGNEVTVSIFQLGKTSGTVYVSVTSTGKTESPRTAITYKAERVTPTLTESQINITNNAGPGDAVTVSGLDQYDIMKIYATSTATAPIGGAIADANGNASASVYQLGEKAGSIYVTVTKIGLLESLRFGKKYTSEISAPLLAADIKVENNYSDNQLSQDIVEVSNLAIGDTVKVYANQKGDVPIGYGIATEDPNDSEKAQKLTISIPPLGEKAGTVYVSVIRVGKSESTTRVSSQYKPEPTTVAPLVDNIKVENNYSSPNSNIPVDIVTVSNLKAGDIVKVYPSLTAAQAIGSCSPVLEGDTSATVDVNLGSQSGTIYVSVKSLDFRESSRTPMKFSPEPISVAPKESNNIEIKNNLLPENDTIQVSNLPDGSKVNVYSSATGGVPLVCGDAVDGKVSLSKDQIGEKAGKLYISIIEKDKLESPRTAKAYLAEDITPAPTEIKITNNVSPPDTDTDNDVITVKGSEGAFVSVFASPKDQTPLKSPVRVIEGIATINLTLPSSKAGVIYISVTNTNPNMHESQRVSKTFSAEPVTPSLEASTITIDNKLISEPDIVTVTAPNILKEGDMIRIYTSATGGSPICEGAVDSTGVAKVTAPKFFLPAKNGGVIYVSVTNSVASESLRTPRTYKGEPASSPPKAETILIENNLEGTPDTVTVPNILVGDIVKVYTSSTGVLPIGEATATETTATVSIYQIGRSGGTVYVSVTSNEQVESTRVSSIYNPEPTSVAPTTSNIGVSNNPEGRFDTVTVSGIKENDIVKVYSTSTSLIPVGGTTSTGTSAIVSIYQLSKVAGTVYVTVTNSGKLESKRVAITYDTETSKSLSTQIAPSEIDIKNDPGTANDNIVVSNVSPDDVVKVFSDAAGVVLLEEGTVAQGAKSIAITLDCLEAEGGIVYLSITRKGYLESVVTAKAYSAEPQP